eukprot:TRINITY_DN20622_c0_g1_i1.p1 TRINITY_DN20622_c0_g1~~TRINITY_DN20622_c0_g1_i1.p1  ORF type:complete len:327 (-),score=76.18 TRINITY_DN20622_c0_g1_i1:89-1069(-)
MQRSTKKVIKRPALKQSSAAAGTAAKDPFLEQVAKIPRGKVLTFRELTAKAGSQGMGGMMAASAKVHRIPGSASSQMPWWRVIFTGDGQVLEKLLQNRGGKFGTVERGKMQRRLLEKEGWKVASDVPRKVQVLCPDDELTVRGVEARKGSSEKAIFSVQKMAQLVAAQPFETLGSGTDILGSGSAVRFPLLSSAECAHLLDFMAEKDRWDRTVRLDRVNYGKVGIYHYIKEDAFSCKPLGLFVAKLRERLYSELMKKLPAEVDFEGGQFFLKDCASGRQRKFDLKEGDCLVFDTGVLASSSKLKHGMTTVSKGKRAVFGFAFHMAA